MTAPQSAAPPTLFATGCCLCGGETYCPRTSPSDGVEPLNKLTGGYVNAGAQWCGDCFNDHGLDAWRLDAEITRRKAIEPAPASDFRPKVGDWVEFDIRGSRTVGRLSCKSALTSSLWAINHGVGMVTARREGEFHPWQPHVGEMCSGDTILDEYPTVTGRFVKLFADKSFTLDVDMGGNVSFPCRPGSLRPSAPDATEGKAPTSRKDPAACKHENWCNLSDWCVDCGTGADTIKRERSAPEPEPEASPWGIVRDDKPEKAAAMRVGLTCNEPGCGCPYCRHRAFSPKLGANDPRHNGGKGPQHSTLDRSIAASRPPASESTGTPAWPSDPDIGELYSTF